MFRSFVFALAVACSAAPSDPDAEAETEADDEIADSEASHAAHDDVLDCAYYASDSNCWDQSQQEATAACQPPEGEQGVLAQDHRSCVFSDGTTVTFHMDLNLDGYGPDDLDITLERDGSVCTLSTVDGLGVSVDGRGTSLESTPNGEVLTCPDGTTYGSSDPLALLSCDWNDLPMVVWSWAPTSFAFGAGDVSTGLWVDCGER